MSVNSDVLISFPVRVVWATLTKRWKAYLSDHTYALLELLPIGLADLKVKDGYLEVDQSASSYGPISSDRACLEGFVSQAFWKALQRSAS